MYYTKNEEKTIKPFCKYLSDSKFANESFLLIWKNGTKITANFCSDDDDDNGLEMDDPNYEEYTSIVMDIKKIINLDQRDGFDWVEGRELFEFNYRNFPDEIYNSKGKLISKK